MKKVLTIISGLAGVILMTVLISASGVPEHPQKKGMARKALPADVVKITDESCFGCHSEEGMKMARMFLNLSEWDKYSAGKQAARANKMCKFVTKGKMPPEKFKVNNPDAVPTKEDIKIICEWAASLKPAEK